MNETGKNSLLIHLQQKKKYKNLYKINARFRIKILPHSLKHIRLGLHQSMLDRPKSVLRG